MKLSICIPTYNRQKYLRNCLHSIASSWSDDFIGHIEICVSDNNSSDNTRSVVAGFSRKIPLRYFCQKENVGVAKNIISVVSMASGDFVWLVGDDDFLVHDAFTRLLRFLRLMPDVDFFYVNAYHMSAEMVERNGGNFKSSGISDGLRRFSNYKKDRTLPFMSLIDPRISFDFLGGMFLSVFRRDLWERSVHAIDSVALSKKGVFSSFENTFPHIHVFAQAFRGSKAYFNSRPMIVCMNGVREWAPLYPLIRSFRLVEALEVYRKNGLSILRYLWCRNFALLHFLPDVARMFLHKSRSGFQYVNVWQSIINNFLYPSVWVSPIVDKYRRTRELSQIERDI